MLATLKILDWIDVDGIFDILDVSNKGLASLGNLVAALQAGGPGSSVKLQEEGLRAHAKQDVRKCISSAHTLVGDLKTQVRQGVRYPERGPMSPAISEDESPSEAEIFRSRQNLRTGSQRGKRSRPTSAVRGNQATCSKPGTSLAADGPAAGSSQPATAISELATSSSGPATTLEDSGKDLHEPRAELNSQSGLQPRLRTFPHQELKSFVRVQTPSEQRRPGTGLRGASVHQLPTHRCVNDNQQSWGSIWKNFKRCTGQKERKQLEEGVQAYYQNATWQLSHDVPILKQSPSRFALHQNARTHYQKIASLSRRNQARDE